MKFNVDKPRSGGVYIIMNPFNGKVYVGRTNNFYNRYHQYVYAYRTRGTKHINSYLMHSMDKYGFDEFEFSVIEYCGIDSQKDRELYWMGVFNSSKRDKGYNLRLDSDGGMIAHNLTREKISNRLKKEWASGVRDSHSEKLRVAWGNRDRDAQSRLMSKTLTKYKYEVYFNEEPITMFYSDLVENGLKNCISSFHRKKSDDIVHKGVRIRRLKVNED